MKVKLISVLALIFPVTLFSQVEIILRQSFIDSLKDKVNIETNFNVIKAHKKANPPSKDGDMHVAGLTDNVGLPVVAEIMNAKTHSVVVNSIHHNEGQNTYLPTKGVWRIWCEHPGASERQQQGKSFPDIVNTNPDHVFEIHPVTEYNNINVLKTIKPIVGYTYKTAEAAFYKYAEVPCKISKKQNDMVSIKTKGIGYNYVDFYIEILDGKQIEVEDGRFVFCSVLDANGEILVNKMRMVFPKGTQAEKAIKDKSEGDVMHVTGIPRISLKLIDYRLKYSDENPDMLEWNLPIEMIVVGNYNN